MPTDFKATMTWSNFAVPATRTATVTGTGVDMIALENDFVAFQHVGTVSGTSPTLDGKFAESDDNVTFTDISGATFTQVTATGTDPAVLRGKRTKRYMRYVGTIAGTSPSFPSSVIVGAPLKVF